MVNDNCAFGSHMISPSISSHWTFPDIGEVAPTYIPSNRTGSPIVVEYAALPSDNDAFGSHDVTVDIIGRGVDGTTDVTFYFDPLAWNHPPAQNEYQEGPNWFYYWRQTSAGYVGTHPASLIRYGGNAGETGGEWFVNNIINIYDATFTFESPMTGVAGIDRFAETLLHEFCHARHYQEWWVDTGYAYAFDLNHPDHGTFDKDFDSVPDEIEILFGLDDNGRYSLANLSDVDVKPQFILEILSNKDRLCVATILSVWLDKPGLF